MGSSRLWIPTGPGVLTALILGCASHVPLEPSPLDARNVLYDALVLEVSTPFAPSATVDVEGGMDGAADGAAMMAAAPLGCLTAGAFAAFCLAMAPFFPIIAAYNAQAPEVSRTELEQLSERILEYDLHGRLAELVERRIVVEGLPLAPAGTTPEGRVATLKITLDPLQLEHSGYKGGSITVLLPYQFALVGADGSVLASRSGRRRDSFDVDEWPADDAAMLTFTLGLWLEQIVEAGLAETLLEWQPPVQLAAVHPQLVSRRNLLGLRYQEWPFAESLTPQLAWGRLEDVLDPVTLGDVSDLTYELEIRALVHGEARWSHVSRTLYARRGLAEPTHVVEESLLPCTRYYWRPLARFRYRGVIHTTSQSSSYVLNTPGPGCEQPAWTVRVDD